MRKLLILAVLTIGMMVSAQAQESLAVVKDGQVYTINDKYIILKDLAVKNTEGSIKVIKEKTVKKDKDTFIYLTLETKGVLVFKNGVLIGGIK